MPSVCNIVAKLWFCELLNGHYCTVSFNDCHHLYYPCYACLSYIILKAPLILWEAYI